MILLYDMSKGVMKEAGVWNDDEHLYYAVIGMVAGGKSPAFCTLEPH
jgi:hypothetical protein